MALRIIATQDERLLCGRVISAVREGLAQQGSALLLLPSFEQALRAQRALAQEDGLSLGVTTTTPSAWARERWEVWGDGRAFADGIVSCVVARETIVEAAPEKRGSIQLSEGTVGVLSGFANQALPWLPLLPDGTPDAAACDQAGLTVAETRLVGLAGAYGERLRERGYVTSAEVAASVPCLLEDAGVQMPAVVLAGFRQMARQDRALVQGLARIAPVTMVVQMGEGAAFASARALVEQLGAPLEEDASLPLRAQRAEGLEQLCQALFSNQPIAPRADGPVSVLLPAGPLAEAELLARCVEGLAKPQDGQDGAESILLVTPDVARMERELLPMLVERGFHVRVHLSRPLAESRSAQLFFGYAAAVGQLADLAASWPAPQPGLDGPVPQLGDMSWWPPREVIDFLLSDIAHMDAQSVWRLDAQWRGNRLLTPAGVLDSLQNEGTVSRPVARSTQELLRGRLGSAASKLLAPYLAHGTERQEAGSSESIAVLQGVMRLAGSLHDLGLTADPSVEGALSLSQLVETAGWAAMGMQVVERSGVVGPAEAEGAGQPLVWLTTASAAASLGPASVDALVITGMTTAESPIARVDDLVPSLLELLGVEPARDVMAEARSRFSLLLGLPRKRLVLERALNDADAKPAYPSVMLSELFAAYGIPAGASPGQITLPVTTWGETSLGLNLARSGERPQPRQVEAPAPAGRLSASSQGLVFVPQDGTEELPAGKPVLSASQIETYLDCPYKWFSLRRLRLGTVDAGHTGMEMGTFAHRVLEVTHRELLARSLEAEQPGLSREELLAAIEQDPAHHVAGSRVSEQNLEEALAVLELEFDLHRQHMYMVRRPRAGQQLLVAHDASEFASEVTLHDDLVSVMGYQTGILAGFEPRLFEWSFGRHGALVPYAGAYFTGTVDRIDVNPHGDAVIIDYKHKSTNGFAAEYDALQEGVLEGAALPRRVQSLIYAQVVRRAFEGRLHLAGTVFLSTKRPHALAGAVDENQANLVFGNLSSARAARVCVPSTGTGSGMDELLDRTEELVAEQVAQMLAGNVEARPRDAHSCDFCPVNSCEKRVMR